MNTSLRNLNVGTRRGSSIELPIPSRAVFPKAEHFHFVLEDVVVHIPEIPPPLHDARERALAEFDFEFSREQAGLGADKVCIAFPRLEASEKMDVIDLHTPSVELHVKSLGVLVEKFADFFAVVEEGNVWNNIVSQTPTLFI